MTIQPHISRSVLQRVITTLLGTSNMTLSTVDTNTLENQSVKI